MNFIDQVKVIFESGRGGDGAASFHREKHVPRGGPNGADGGRGGDIVLVADSHKRTLYDFKLEDHFKAPDGTKAVLNKRGRDGADVVIKLPVGTIVTDSLTGEVIVDLDHDGMAFVLCKGGRGGNGNVHYTTSVRQAPTFAQKGGPPAVVEAGLELKLLADAALIGLPNAGKSTLLSRLSAAKPKIADYPFTTLVPNLGVVLVDDSTFVLADLPGLIEGASEGVGLGHQFLKHAERNRVLLHLVDAFPLDESDPWENYVLIEEELRQYSTELYSRPRVVALTKADVSSKEAAEAVAEIFRAKRVEARVISAVAGAGLDALKREMLAIIAKQTEEDHMQKLVPVLSMKSSDQWTAEKVGQVYRVTGKRVEEMVAMTDLENSEALMYLHRRLQRIGVIQRLREMGIQEGDTVEVGSFNFEYED